MRIRTLLLTLFAALWAAPIAGAATMTVTTAGDSVSAGLGCTLREAVINANTNSAAGDPVCGVGDPAPTTDVIQLLDVDADHELEIAGAGEDAAATGDLDVLASGGPLEISGAGPEQTTVSAADLDRVFHLQGGGSLTLVGLTVSDGRIANGDGAGVRAAGSLELRDVFVISNDLTANTIVSLRGAGVFVSAGPLLVEDSGFGANTITPANGSATGAGIAISGASARIERSGFGDNTISGVSAAQTGAGGGLGIVGTAGGDVEITDSLFVDNSVGGTTGTRRGGGIAWADDAANDDSLLVENSTFTSNTVGAGQNGGGIYLDGGDNSIAFTTFGPTAPANMNGAGYYFDAPGSVEVRASVFATETDDDCNTGTSLGYNVERETPGDDCHFDEPTDVLTGHPVIDPTIQEENGGPMPTHQLDLATPGNPAIDNVPLTDCLGADGAPLGADQRGVPRPFDEGGAPGPQCDAGSYEVSRCHGVLVNVIGTPGDDELFSPFLPASNVADGVLGLGGDDTINALNGADAVCAGLGADTLTDSDSIPEVALDGQAGTDTFSAPGTAGDTIDLASGVARTPAGGDADPLLGIENAAGGEGNDVLTGGAGANLLEGGPDADTLLARDGGPDSVDCGAGTDSAVTDQRGLDPTVGCETVDALADPVFPPVTQQPAAKPKRKCRKGQKLKKGKCVKKRKRKKK